MAFVGLPVRTHGRKQQMKRRTAIARQAHPAAEIQDHAEMQNLHDESLLCVESLYRNLPEHKR
jgi:hypothetical protein